MGFVPLSEWCRVDHDDTILHESLCSDELVVAGIVDNIDDSGFPCAMLTSPGKVTVVQSKSTCFEVSSPDTNSPHSSDTDLRNNV